MKLPLLTLTCISLHASALSPEQERASFRLADDSLTVELVAAEPKILSPVALAWDGLARLFVAEMIDYPVGPGSGQIRMLRDLDSDGVYETSTVFADQLPFPNGVLPWKDGLLVTAAPHILFLRDTDGDGRADERRVILTGFAEGNQQLRVNGLFLGLDGWIYGANGRSDGELRRPGEDHGISLRGHDFRFQPDTGDYEAIAGRSQFGLGHDDWGNRFLSWNTIAIRHEVIPERFLALHPRIPITEAVHDLAPEGDTGAVFPLTPAPQTFNQESTSHFNALAGLHIYRGDALPARYYGHAFLGETLRNLVHHRALETSGPTFVARRVETEKEFLASTDPWFHPVNFATGPDGALYIADFYRQWVEHPGYVPEKFRDKFAWRTGAEHGRIWRIRPRAWQRPPSPIPGSASVSALAHPNGWTRDNAFRSLLESRDEKTISGLKLVARSLSPQGAVLALHLLSRHGALDAETARFAQQSAHPRVREAISRLAATPPLLDDPDPSVRLWAILSGASATNTVRDLDSLVRLATRPDLDHITAVALRLCVTGSAEPFLTKLQAARPAPRPFLLELIQNLAEDSAPGRAASIRDVQTPSDIDLAVLAGFARTGGKTDRAWASPSLAQKYVPAAIRTATNSEVSSIARACALQVLAFLAPAENSPTLLGFLLPPTEETLQRAAAQALVESGPPALFASALHSWDRYQIATRRQLLAGAARSSETAAPLFAALKAGQVSPTELDPFLRQNLLRLSSGESKARLQELLGPAVSADRAAVIERFSAALPLPGDSLRGRALFEKACAQCHAYAGFSGHVGPNLSGINTRPKESLLVDILDPSRQVPPEFLNYTVFTTDGESLNGLLLSDNPGSITLRRPNLPDETLPRSRVKSIQAGKLSLMPDGLDAGLSIQEMADLLQFLTQPASP